MKNKVGKVNGILKQDANKRKLPLKKVVEKGNNPRNK